MAKVRHFAKAFAGRWRIVEMDNWDSDFLDLVEEAHLTFEGRRGSRTASRPHPERVWRLLSAEPDWPGPAP